MSTISKSINRLRARHQMPTTNAPQLHSANVSTRLVAKGYGDAGASWQKKAVKGFTAQSGSPREDIDANNYTLRQRARMLYMAAPIATSAIKTNRTNVIGVGLQLKSRVNRTVLGMDEAAAETWQKRTEAEFALWATQKRACDATGVNDFYAMQQLALTSWLTSGDVFAVFKRYDPTALMPYSLRVHIIEADRVSTPSTAGLLHPMAMTTGKAENGNAIFDGVEVDGNGMIVAYHIRNNYPLEFNTLKTDWIRVQAYGDATGLPNIIQVMDSERPEQYRGVSYLAHVIEPLLQLRRYTESELMAAVVESFFTAFVTTEGPTSQIPFSETGEGESEDPNEYEMGPGQVNHMKPGESVMFADPKRPSSGFQTFARSISEQVGAALEIPADLLLKAFNASYSASRGALLEAWKAFRMRRVWFANDFCRPIYEVWLSEAVARGRIQAPGFFISPIIRAAYLGSEWIGPSQGQLDPVKEITAEILAVGEGFSTREQSTVRLGGGDWDSNMTKIKLENQKLADASVQSTGQTAGGDPDPLTAAVKAVIFKAIKDGDTNAG